MFCAAFASPVELWLSCGVAIVKMTLAASVCLVVSAIMLSPFMNLWHIGSALHVGDGRVQAWVLAWVAHAVTTGAPLFDANMFYPVPASLAHTDSMVALGLLATPIWLLTGNAILAFNLLQLLGPTVTSVAAFVLLRTWTEDWLASLVGGLTFGLSFFALLHNAHLNLTWAAGFPLSMLYLERWWRRPTWSSLFCIAAAFVFTALCSWYLALMLALVVALHVAFLAMTFGRVDIGLRGPQVIAVSLLSAAVLLPFLSPYLGRTGESGEAAAYAADLRSYVVPPENTVLGRWLVGHRLVEAQSIWGERTLYQGWSTMAVACLGFADLLRSGRREHRLRGLLLLATLLVGLGLSFGPSPRGWAPFDVLSQLPAVGAFRATARFGLLVGLAGAAFVTFGLVRIRQLAPRAAPFILCAFAALLMAERFVVDFPAGQPQPEKLPEVYALARADGARAAIALPIYAGLPSWFFEGDYLVYSTTANFLPLANGIGRWVPSEYLALGEAMRTFPSRASADSLHFYGITHTIVHTARFGERAADLIAQIRRSADYSIVAERGQDLLLRVMSY